MSWRLVAEVLDHTPQLATAERLLLVAIAEQAREKTRTADVPTDLLVRRVGVKASAIRNMLARMAKDRGMDLRVPRGVDKTGATVYAWRGSAPTYRIPELPASPGCVCASCREGATGVAPSIVEGATDVAPSTRKGATTNAEGATTTVEGATPTHGRRYARSTHPSGDSPNGESTGRRKRASSRSASQRTTRASPTVTARVTTGKPKQGAPLDDESTRQRRVEQAAQEAQRRYGLDVDGALEVAQNLTPSGYVPPEEWTEQAWTEAHQDWLDYQRALADEET